MTVINIFTKADSVAALIWASALACAVSMVMLLLPRTLTLQEYMEVIKYAFLVVTESHVDIYSNYF